MIIQNIFIICSSCEYQSAPIPFPIKTAKLLVTWVDIGADFMGVFKEFSKENCKKCRFEF